MLEDYVLLHRWSPGRRACLLPYIAKQALLRIVILLYFSRSPPVSHNYFEISRMRGRHRNMPTKTIWLSIKTIYKPWFVDIKCYRLYLKYKYASRIIKFSILQTLCGIWFTVTYRKDCSTHKMIEIYLF